MSTSSSSGAADQYTQSYASASYPLPSTLPSWKALKQHVDSQLANTHLKDLLQDQDRLSHCLLEHDNILLDYSRQRVTPTTLNLLFDLYNEANVAHKVNAMRLGHHVNTTEDRAALHWALRASNKDVYNLDGHDVVPEVVKAKERILSLSEAIRNGKVVGKTYYPIQNIIVIGIGGSYLGTNFMSEALKEFPEAKEAAKGRQLRYLANIDPIAVHLATEGLEPKETMAIIISKTFTTRETMINAESIKQWFVRGLGDSPDLVSQHFLAVSSNVELCTKWGINPVNIVPMWDWVGGRYSVLSAVGLLPLAIHYSFELVNQILMGANSMDNYFFNTPARKNIVVLMALLGILNTNFYQYSNRALICYNEALNKLCNHIQQLSMESNGKNITLNNLNIMDNVNPADRYTTGEIEFGEAGTNCQHSFFQLLHQGQTVPIDFVGFVESQHDIVLGSGHSNSTALVNPANQASSVISNHHELMCNFFAQPDALAIGKTKEEILAENRANPNIQAILSHKVFQGNRPSNVLLINKLTPFAIGQLLSLFENRTIVQGFIWNINSFDQWGVELGKKLADTVRGQLQLSLNNFVAGSAAPEEKEKDGQNAIDKRKFNPSTQYLLNRYISQHKKAKL